MATMRMTKRALLLSLAGIVAAGTASAEPPKKKEPDKAAADKAKEAAKDKDAAPAPAEARKPPRDDLEAASFFFDDSEQAGWSQDRCASSADKFVAAGKGKRADAFFNAGVAYQRCGKLADAEKHWRKALDLDPKYGPALASMGELALRNGKEKDAQDLFQRAIQNDAKAEVTSARNNMAWLQYQQIRQTSVPATRAQLEADALNNLRGTLAIDNDNVVAYTIMALMYMEGADKNRNRLDIADLLITEGKKRNDRFAPLWNASGLLKMKRQNVAKALEDFRQASTLDPKLVEARLNVGQIVLSARNYDEAENQFREALKLRKNDYGALIGLGIALRGQATVARAAGQADKFQKKIDEAESTYKAALDVDKNRGDAYYNLGLLYKDYRTNDPDQTKNIGQYKKAKQFFQDFLSRADKTDQKRDDAQGHIQDCDKYVEILGKVAQDGGGSPTAGGK